MGPIRASAQFLVPFGPPRPGGPHLSISRLPGDPDRFLLPWLPGQVSPQPNSKNQKPVVRVCALGIPDGTHSAATAGFRVGPSL